MGSTSETSLEQELAAATTSEQATTAALEALVRREEFIRPLP
jgi:hypothetical protein